MLYYENTKAHNSELDAEKKTLLTKHVWCANWFNIDGINVHGDREYSLEVD